MPENSNILPTYTDSGPRFPPNRGRTKRARLPEWMRISLIMLMGSVVGLAAFYIFRTAGY